MKQDKYNILFLSSWYPTKLFPFRGDFVKRHAKAVSLFSNVFVLHVIKDNQLKVNSLMHENSDDNLREVIYYFNSKMFNRLHFVYYYFKGYYYIKNKYGKPDIIHGNVLFPIGVIVFLISIFNKTPYVLTEHWTGYSNGKYKEIRNIVRACFNWFGKKSSYILPVTNDLKNSMIKAGVNGKFKIVPNVVETNFFKLRDEELNQNKKSILHVSNIRDEHKNISGLLRVISKLSSVRSDFILNIIHSEENDVLIELSDNLRIKDSFVRFCGRKDYTEVAEYMSKSAFLVLFSNFENLPCVIVEAFASGLPVLSTDVGGIKEHLDSKKGVLIQKGDEEALFEKMNFMLDHYQEYDKKELRDYAISNFSYEEIGRKYYKIYQEILHV